MLPLSRKLTPVRSHYGSEGGHSSIHDREEGVVGSVVVECESVVTGCVTGYL